MHSNDNREFISTVLNTILICLLLYSVNLAVKTFIIEPPHTINHQEFALNFCESLDCVIKYLQVANNPAFAYKVDIPEYFCPNVECKNLYNFYHDQIGNIDIDGVYR